MCKDELDKNRSYQGHNNHTPLALAKNPSICWLDPRQPAVYLEFPRIGFLPTAARTTLSFPAPVRTAILERIGRLRLWGILCRLVSYVSFSNFLLSAS